MAQETLLILQTINNKSTSFLYNSIPNRVKFYSIWSSQINNISKIETRPGFFRIFFHSATTEWNKLVHDIRKSDSLNVITLSLYEIIRPVAISVFFINNPHGLKFFTRLRLGLINLRYHKFRHNFQDCINPICAYCLDIETTTHFLLHCPFLQSARQFLATNIKKFDESIFKKHCQIIICMAIEDLTCLAISL